MRTGNLDISVVIPMYNVEKFILPLLRDLKMQKIDSAEFLLINDGSTDSTSKLVKSFMHSNHDRRFVLINKKNGGVSSARNYGLRFASGKYIIFIDADDRLRDNFLEKYLGQIKKNKTDIEIFSAVKADALGNIKGKIDYSSIANETITSEDFMKYICTGKAYGFLFSYIFKKELWQNVEFSKKITYEEDLLAICIIMLKNPNIRIHINDEIYYYYTTNALSATNTIKLPELYRNLQRINKSLVEILKEANTNHKIDNYILNMRLDSLIIIIQTSLYVQSSSYYKKAKKEFLRSVWKLKYISIKIMMKRVVQVISLLFNIKKFFIENYVKYRN